MILVALVWDPIVTWQWWVTLIEIAMVGLSLFLTVPVVAHHTLRRLLRHRRARRTAGEIDHLRAIRTVQTDGPKTMSDEGLPRNVTVLLKPVTRPTPGQEKSKIALFSPI